ncbi:uncharacterized protein LOC133854253 isoform X2 [Alnus glutinosa]|uniref:uncharacterized protein LOC133854253 isoform X2 n=1 Tax=Alnus glutinosa TaxID=3517 RepID=UPI002D76E217|nr:uncharacterized protein LOC133854253 isoform X2 [Alnus glutinosa]
MAEPEQSAMFRTGNLLAGDGETASLAMKKKKRKKRNFLPSTAVSSLNLSASSSTPQSQAHDPNLNLTHENGIAPCADYLNSNIKPDGNLVIDCFDDTNNNDKKKKKSKSKSKKGLELEESWVVSPPGTRRSNGTDPNEVEEEKDCNKKKEKRRRKRNDSKCCEVVKEEDRAFEFDKQKREPDYRIKSRIGPFDASLEDEILTLEDVLSRSIYKSNGTRTDLKDGQHDDEEEPNFSFKAVSNNPSIRAIDGCCNLAGEVEDEAVIIPSIYASLKEENVQQNELEVGKAVGYKQRRRKEKQRTIAHADVRKVSPYFWRSTGQQEVRNDGNGRRFSPTRACAKAGATCVMVSPYFEKIPKEGENADVPNLNLTHENGIASCDDYLNSRKRRKINDIKRDVNLAINCYNDTNNNDNNNNNKKKKSNPSSSKKGLELEESWVVPSSGTRCSYASPTHDTAPNEIEEEKDCNKSKDKRRKRNDSNTDKRKRKRNDSKCCELMKEEDKAFEFDMQKRDPGYQMKSRIGPLDGSYENEVLKLEDVLSQSIYKSNGTRTNLKDGQHDDEEEPTFSFKVTNNPSILDIDGGCNLAGEVENEAVILPSIYPSLKEEVQQNELEIGKIVRSKRRGRNEKQQTIAHVDSAPNEIEEEEDCNKSKDKRRRKRNDSKCCDLVKEEGKAFEFDMPKRDLGYQMKSRIGPLDGSYENEVLKLEDVLSRSIYKSNGTRTNLKDSQHDDEEEPTFSFKVTNNPSILDIDGGCNLAGEVENEAVILPSIYSSLKEEVQQNELEIGKIVRSKRRRRNEKQQTIAHVDSAPNEIKEEEDCNKSKDKRRRRKRNDSKCCELVKEEGKAFEFDMQKRDPGYQMKSRIGPLDGSYENEVLKLEDVLSRSIYKSNGTRTNLKDGQHDDGEETTFSFKVTNNPSILAIDGGCNLAGEVEKEAVVIPSSYESLKEEVQQNELEIGKTVGSKRRRRNEKQQTIAHVNVRNVSPYFCRSTGQQEVRNDDNDRQFSLTRACAKARATSVKVSPYFQKIPKEEQQEVRNDGNDRQLRPTKACTKARATSVKVSPYFQKMPKEEENADGLLLEGKNWCKTDVRVETVLSTSEKLHTAYRRKSPDNMWKPPRSSYGLLQEDHAHDPWRVLVICMLLNRTTGLQAKRVISDLFTLCPDAKTATEVTPEEIEKIIKTLGLQRKRAAMIQRLSQEYLWESWTHVTQLHGVGMQLMRMQYFVQEVGTW